MWKIFITLLMLASSYALARLHATNNMMLHAGLGGSLGSLPGTTSIAMGGKEAHVKTKDVDAVEGKSVSLPCPISTPLDDVYMVLWFRDNAGIPLYSFDVRDKVNSEQPRHWSAPEVFGSRAKFHFDSQPATLEIKDIKRHDQGIYRCRIDFRTSQTQSFRFNLSVIILPETPIILDRWGRQMNGTKLGPKQEGDDIVITCRVVGGRPQPEVRWLVNGLLVDNQYEHNSGDVIENRLLWPSVQRTDLNSVFTCQAENTQLDKPKEKNFLLDMHLKPLTVKILDQPSSMVADRRYEVVCESTGSRPNAIITWYKGKRQLRRTKDDISKNTTRSELSFVPTTDDDGKSITCRAENPTVNGLFLETQWKLNVVYPPLVTLRLGSTLTPDDIKEGDDVYFECHVQSNPQWRKLLWLHNGIHLEHNTSARVIRSNQSLVLQKITKHYAGNYACSAINDEGETVSNQLPLRVKYTPVCKHMDRVILIGASKDETVEVACEIQADPPPRTFRWKFNNSGETIDMGIERFSINGSRSILKYTPVTDQDYGTLSCWASNEVGTQSQPCLFQVVLAVLPNAVANCTLFNRTELSVDIQCIPGYDGGLPQIFVLEMYSTRNGITRFNLTNPEEPMFSLENLDTLTSLMTQENNSLKLRIYAVNQKGRSTAYALHDFIIGSNRYRGEEDVPLALSPVIVGSVLTIVIISLAVAIRIFMMTFLHNLRRQRQHGGKATVVGGAGTQTADVYKKSGNLEKPRWQHTDIKTKSSEDLMEDERDPDVIPSQYVVGGNSTSMGSSGSSGGHSATSHDLHITPTTTSKRSPNSNHASTYDTALHQAAGNCATNINNTTKILSSTAAATNMPITYNQIHARAQLMTAVASTNATITTTTNTTIISPTAATTTAAVTYQHISADYELGALLAQSSANANAASAAAAATAAHYHHQQQNQHKKYHNNSGTLPTGLGSGGGYILNSIINNSSANATASTILHSSNSSISRALLQQQQQQQQHSNSSSSSQYDGVGSKLSSRLVGGLHHMPPIYATLHHGSTSTTSSAASSASALNMSHSNSGGGLGDLLMRNTNTMSNIGAGGGSLLPSTTETSCNSSTDLDDNININAIKDCLMTQRVPESCV